MKSIRSRFTFLTTFAVIISVLATIMIFYFPVTGYLRDRTDEVLSLVCAERQEALDSYFNSIEQSVDTVANYAEDDIAEEADLDAHIAKTEKLFSTIASNTQGTLTYYYRVDPEIAGGDKGFWYQGGKVSGEFRSSDLTEIERYDPGDISRVGWYHIPKETGKPVWIEPYFNENMGVKMISYVVPVYRDGTFFGVAGMDFSYDSLVANMEDIDEFRTGYAFLSNKNGEIIYHKDLESGTHISDVVPGKVLAAAEGDRAVVRYTFNGTRKMAASAVLSNDMRLFVTVNESEISVILNLLIIADEALNILFLFLYKGNVVLDGVDHLVNGVIDILAIFYALEDFLEPEGHGHLGIANRYHESVSHTIRRLDSSKLHGDTLKASVLNLFGYKIHNCVLECFKFHLSLPSFLIHRALSFQAHFLTR